MRLAYNPATADAPKFLQNIAQYGHNATPRTLRNKAMGKHLTNLAPSNREFTTMTKNQCAQRNAAIPSLMNLDDGSGLTMPPVAAERRLQ